MNSLDITSKEISSLSEMDKLFEEYCKKNGIALDFTRGSCCNAYIDRETSSNYIWFLRGVFRAIGDKHLEKLLTKGASNEVSY